MFVRFTKRKGSPDVIYRRAVAINGTYLVQEGDEIVAYAILTNQVRLLECDDKYPKYRIWVMECDHTEELERYVKRFIGNSAKWEQENYKRRFYDVVRFKQGIFSKSNFKIVFSWL